MAGKLPPQPVGVAPGSAYWNDWYEKLRLLINNSTATQLTQAQYDDLTDGGTATIHTHSHQALANNQGGTGGEYYHLTSAQHAIATTLASGTYTPTLTNSANIASSAAVSAQYLRVGSVVTVSGQVSIDPTAASVATVLDISLPIASNLANTNELAGTAASHEVFAYSAAIHGNAGLNTASLDFINGADVANRTWSFTFTYRII